MKPPSPKKQTASSLREAAEARATRDTATPQPALPITELLHELKVHQIELEMQNETLRKAQLALTESRDNYFDLYEFAPVGYLTLAADNFIAHINLTGATLLGRARKQLLGKSFVSMVMPDDRPLWLHYLKNVKLGDQGADVELVLQRGDGAAFEARLDCVRRHTNPATRKGRMPELRVTINDISKLKHAEQAFAMQAQRLLALSRQVTEVEAQERRRLARELHDRVGQNLSSLIMSLNMIKREMPAAALKRTASWFDDSAKLLGQTISEVRAVMSDLRPAELDDFGLVRALGFYAEQTGMRAGFTVAVSGPSHETRLPIGVETALYRIGQEAVTNIAKHAGATKVEIIIATTATGLSLQVTDNGHGISSGKPAHASNHRGMRGMRERTEAIGAHFAIHSAWGRGTTLSVNVILPSDLPTKTEPW